MEYPGRTIKKGEKDKVIVKTIQVQLNDRGFGIIDVDGDFGQSTQSAVRLFQSQTRDAQGIPLIVDGKLGPISWAALFKAGVITPPPVRQSHPLVSKVLEIAATQVGVLEDPPGSNRGAQVEKFLASAGCQPGDPWCASFVYWCFNEAAKSLNVTNPLIKTGGCLDHWTRTKGMKISRLNATNNVSLIKPGFIFIMDHGSGKGHTGIVTNAADGYIQTIEGNTNIAGSREGLGVAELKRKINTISAGFIDYTS
jgi:hypothetical protein